jgi:hypothetical protein
MAKQPTRAQVELRVREILRIRLDGGRFWDALEYLREREAAGDPVWKLEEGAKPLANSTLWRYIALADKQCASDTLRSRKKLLRRHLDQRRNLYGKALLAGDVRAALACLADEARLLHLYDTPARKPADGPPLAPAEVANMLSSELRAVAAAKLPASERAKLITTMSGALLQALGVTDLAGQLEELRRLFDEVKRHAGHTQTRSDEAAGGNAPADGERESAAEPSAG